MAEWKDTSSYSRSDTDRTPRTWRMTLKRLSFVVTRHRDYAPDEWVFRCHELGLEAKLKSKGQEEAKQEALRIMRRVIKETLDELDSVPSLL
jgi:hypothetical protein